MKSTQTTALEIIVVIEPINLYIEETAAKSMLLILGNFKTTNPGY